LFSEPRPALPPAGAPAAQVGVVELDPAVELAVVLAHVTFGAEWIGGALLIANVRTRAVSAALIPILLGAGAYALDNRRVPARPHLQTA